MGVAVYPRLGELLRESNLTVADLERQIELYYGLSVDQQALNELVHAGPIRRADLEVAAAVAAVLGIGLGDLFEIEAAPVLPPEEPVLDPEQSRRLDELFEAQSRRDLSPAERSEVEALVAEHSRRLQEQALPRIAAKRNISVDQARREVRAELEEAIRWWEEFEADPRRRKALVAQVRRQRARRARAAAD